MPDEQNRSLDKTNKEEKQYYGGIFNNLRLIVRLLKDHRVNFLLKLLPIAALIYLIIPIDFLPINPLEDVVVLWLGGTLFIELCPDEIVAEHRKALQRESNGVDITETPPHEIIDGEYKDLPPDEK